MLSECDCDMAHVPRKLVQSGDVVGVARKCIDCEALCRFPAIFVTFCSVGSSLCEFAWAEVSNC